MKKVLCMAAMILAMGTKTVHAQIVSLDEAIRNVATEFSQNIDSGSGVAVIAIQADSVGMSNHLINGMIAALFNARAERGFEVASRGQIELLMGEHELNMAGLVDDARAVSIGRLAGARFILTGSFVPAGDAYVFWAQLIHVETGFFRGISNVTVRNDGFVSSLLGIAGRAPPPPPPVTHYNHFTADQRWRTFGLNFIPGLGSFLIMGDVFGGVFQAVCGAAMILSIVLMTNNGVDAGSFTVGRNMLSVSSFTWVFFNIIRSMGFKRRAPNPRAATALNLEAWNVALTPGKNGIEGVSLSRSLRF